MEQRTIGMRLDAAIAQLDSLSSTQLYALIVCLIIMVSFIILGPASEMPHDDEPSSLPPPPKPKAASTPSSHKIKYHREPRWHIFRWVNYASVLVFGWSVVDFGIHCSDYLQDSDVMLKFLFAWSILVCYFFAFFGISFVHDTIEGNEPVLLQGHESRSGKITLPPANSTPICGDGSLCNSKSISSYKKKMSLDSDETLAKMVLSGEIKDHELEKRLDPHRAVPVRRLVVDSKLASTGKAGALEKLPYRHDLDYSRVYGANCEIVVGYVPIPVGMVGPMTLDGESIFVPMATTEGCLVASTNRGAKAITQGGGANAAIVRDGITRAPCVRMGSAMDAARLKIWCEAPQNFALLKQTFEATTSFGKLKSCVPTIAGKNVYLRLTCFSGDAMGMNMVSKGSLAVIEYLKNEFPSLQLVALSGNMCTDKKAAATNWIEGRGKSVVVEATIPKEVVRTTLKTSVHAMVETNLHKNLIGSAMACTVGGFNAHASNIVTAVFLATGQDPAQNVESSNCITLMEETDNGDLWISCTMPSLEVGTVGGGTSLEAQGSCLRVIGCKGGGATPGENAQKLAKVVAAATMAGELSLIAALAANTLVAAHMEHNRKPIITKEVK